jgi:hypothetical protein
MSSIIFGESWHGSVCGSRRGSHLTTTKGTDVRFLSVATEQGPPTFSMTGSRNISHHAGESCTGEV